MTPAEIAGLAERCERATPADLSDLGLALRLVFPDAVLDTLTSLDAAVRFVERVLPSARHGYEQEPDRSFFATIRPTHDRVTQRHQHGQAATPALALVAAALRALAARDGGGA